MSASSPIKDGLGGFVDRVVIRGSSDDDCYPGSPQDSGYGSKAVTPEKSPSPRESLDYGRLAYGHHGFFDGNSSSDFWGSSDDKNEYEDRTEVSASSTVRAVETPKFATLPSQARASRSQIPAAFFSNKIPSSARRSRRSSDAGPSRDVVSSLRFPDRFVTLRDNADTVAERFRANKHPQELTTLERLLRNSDVARDPFFPPRRVAPPIAGYRQLSRSDTGLLARGRVRTVLGPLDVNGSYTRRRGPTSRIVSSGSVWGVGGPIPWGTALNDGRGHLIQSGTNAPLFTSSFPQLIPKTEDEHRHRDRLAAALGLDLASKVLEREPFKNNSAVDQSKKQMLERLPHRKTFWDGSKWVKEGSEAKTRKQHEVRTLPVAPFKVLDAPGLRDDFYCSVLAYSPTSNVLLVGLGNDLYRWSEASGVTFLNGGISRSTWLTALAFSSAEGGKDILAYGRSDSSFGLMSMPEDGTPRMIVHEQAPVACLSWRPTSIMRPSKNPHNPDVLVPTEDLLVGDELGCVRYYIVEWPDAWEVKRDNWRGELTLMACVTAHLQQICGLAWSHDGDLFASGGNDNLCCLYAVEDVLRTRKKRDGSFREEPVRGQALVNDPLRNDGNKLWASYAAGNASAVIYVTISTAQEQREKIERREWRAGRRATRPKSGEINLEADAKFGTARIAGAEAARYQWEHGAAVKAIAFCPWQSGLVATGGGSNDKCIHFFHTTSGAALATIAVSAQVTSLIWSTTRREIAATFGYAQPEHPVRVAIFSWPECRQVAAIPWVGEHRALYAIPYSRATIEGGGEESKEKSPERPESRSGVRDGDDGGEGAVSGGDDNDNGTPESKPKPKRQPPQDGCIIIAASDESVKFHEVWPAAKRIATGGVGMLGGSDILEDMEGIDKEGDIIR